MDQKRFKELLEELDGTSLETLIQKNAKYASKTDCLHNFDEGGDIFGGTSADACWGYLTKHLVALRDKVKNNDFSDREDFLEKCQDSINYIRFLWCIGNDIEVNKMKVSAETALSNRDTINPPLYLYHSIDKIAEIMKFVQDAINTNGYITVAQYKFKAGHFSDIDDGDEDYGWRVMPGYMANSMVEKANKELVFALALPDPIKL